MKAMQNNNRIPATKKLKKVFIVIQFNLISRKFVATPLKHASKTFPNENLFTFVT
jgi:hypothetical protein